LIDGRREGSIYSSRFLGDTGSQPGIIGGLLCINNRTTLQAQIALSIMFGRHRGFLSSSERGDRFDGEIMFRYLMHVIRRRILGQVMDICALPRVCGKERKYNNETKEPSKCQKNLPVASSPVNLAPIADFFVSEIHLKAESGEKLTQRRRSRSQFHRSWLIDH